MDKRSRTRILFEDVLGIRVKPKPSKFNKVPIEQPGDTLGDTLLDGDLDGTNIVDISQLNEFRTMSSDRETQYRIYDEMALDSVIASALEMYADDATQYNSKGQIIWAESEDSDISAFANRLIDVLDLNKNAWSHIYCMVKYGDLYLETFRDDENDEDPLLQKDLSYSSDVKVQEHKNGSIMEEYIEAVPNPAELFDLTKRGKTVGFIRVPVNDANSIEPKYNYQFVQEGTETIVLPPDKYVHIPLTNNTDRFPETVTISFNDGEISEVESKSYKYNVVRGKSILHDIYKVYKELKLMEDALLLNRVTRSSIIRIMQIEVGDMPKNQARELLKRVKTLIEQKNYMDKNDGTYQSMASPGPIDNVIYVPTHNGKGSISASNLGGDVDVKSIVDIDYFKNKLYGGLKIPKQFLGDDMEGSGLSAGTSLTKLDSRYARTIKRIQNAYISGITTLINLFAISKGLNDHVNNFTIKMVSPSTVEDSERDEVMDNRMNMVGTFLDLIGDETMFNPETRKEVLLYFINNFLNEPDIAEILEDDDTVKENQDDSDESGIDGDFSTDFDSGGSDFDDFGGDLDTELDTDVQQTNDIETPEITNDDDFGDFSEEF